MVFMKSWKGDHLPALSISARGAAGSTGKSDWIHSKGTQKSHRHRAFWKFLSRFCKELIKAHWHFYNDNINIHKLQHRRIIASQHISTGMQCWMCWCLLQCLCSTIPQPTQVWCPRSEEGRCTEKLSSALASEVPRRASTKCEKNCIFQEGVGVHLSPTFIRFIHLHTSSYRSKSVYHGLPSVLFHFVFSSNPALQVANGAPLEESPLVPHCAALDTQWLEKRLPAARCIASPSPADLFRLEGTWSKSGDPWGPSFQIA